MRDYGKVAPKFWTGGGTAKALRRRGSEAVVVALYLMTSPHSNMLGLYSQPILYMAHETGLGIEGASKGLACCIEEGFCSYDDDSEMVWVHEMAAYQIADELKSGDKRCSGIQKDYDALPSNPFLGAFFDRYAKAFNLSRRRDFEPPKPPIPASPYPSPIEAPTKPGTGTGTGARDGGRGLTIEGASAPIPSPAPKPELVLIAPEPPPRPVIAIPLVDGSDFEVMPPHVAEWRAAFPAVDVPQQLREMRVWCQANPKQRKTSAGVQRFITTWLGKEQDKGGSRPAAPAAAGLDFAGIR